MRNRMLTCLAGALLTAALVQFALGAHSSTAVGTLRGAVTDPSGAAIPGATVIVSGRNLVQSVATDESGQFAYSGLLPGHYRVQIYSPGFSRFDDSDLVVTAGHETEANAQLAISELKQEITVTAAP